MKDTLSITNDLTAAGMKREHAEAYATALYRMATKSMNDTIAIVNYLTDAGIKREHAEAFARVLSKEL